MRAKAMFLAVAAVFAETALAQALPTGGTVSAGSATINPPVAGSLVVNQASPRAIIDWASFNIGNGASVQFSQPAASSVAVNRVGPSAGASAIDGMLSANGQVMILNPNGVMFGATASVNVAGLVASTGNINDALFMASATAPIAITGATAGSISNQGSITVSGAGLAAFVAPSLANAGTITAASGRITLASAQAATVSFNGGLYEIAVNQGVAGGAISNSGSLSAPGGTIVLSALDAANLVSGVINLEGVQQASRIEVHGGQVVLKSDLSAATVTGTSARADVCSCGRIQDGIDIAADGATVNVDAGTYAEQLAITRSLTLRGAGADQTIVAPPSLAAGENGIRSILSIDAPGTSAEVSGFTFRGPVPEITSGIFVRDGAHANIHDNKVIDIRESAILSGNQRGIGIFVGRALFGTSGTAVIANNVITGYQKGGIVVDGPGSQATITGNTVVGEGPAVALAQNGIQISRGATATLTANNVSGNLYTGPGTDPDDFAAGILFFASGPYVGTGGMTFAPNNIVTGNELGVWTNDPGPLATMNLSGVSGNGRNAVAFFNGGYAGQGPLLEYPAWSAANTAFVNAGAFNGTQAGDIVVVSGSPGVSGWSGFSAIQPAIDAVAAGATVNVSPGSYAEQLTLAKDLTLAGAGATTTIVRPNLLAADAGGTRSILTIGGGADVEVSGFTFQGPVPEITSGIFVRDGAHAHIHDNRLLDIRESAALSGNQRGVGILVGRALLGTSGTALIEENVITGYQKGGIVVDGPGSQATITGNTITGEGPTGVIAQNGIQASRGASATITGNTVSGNHYTGASDEATAILIFTPGFYLGQGSVAVGANHVTGNEVGVWTNDPATLANISLSGVGGNTRNGVADFGGGYAGQGQLLEYPAWSASGSALVNAAAFAGTQDGDLVNAGGALRVSGWSGFAAIQPALDAVAAGGTLNVAAGTYPENVVVNAARNLTFSGATLASLTVDAGGSGIGGSATASGSGGFSLNAPIVLLSDTTLVTTGANIAFNADIQNGGTTPYALRLSAGAGDVFLVSGGAAGSPLGRFEVTANNFSLLGTLWVSGYSIDALGTVALSDSTLRSLGGDGNSISAGGGVTGRTVSSGPLVIHSGAPVEITGSAPSLVLDAPGGSVSGDFGTVANVGSGVVEVNGQPTVPVTASNDRGRIMRQESAITSEAAPAGTAPSSDATATEDGGEVGGRAVRVVRRSPQEAGAALDLGQGVEIDLAPRNVR